MTHYMNQIKVEDIHKWISKAFKEISSKKDLIQKAFQSAGFLHEEQSIQEDSKTFLNVEMEEEIITECFPLEEDVEEENDQNNQELVDINYPDKMEEEFSQRQTIFEDVGRYNQVSQQPEVIKT